MNERQQSHINHFNERLAHYLKVRKEKWEARLLAARDADEAFPLRSEEEAAEVVAFLHGQHEKRVTSDE